MLKVGGVAMLDGPAVCAAPGQRREHDSRLAGATAGGSIFTGMMAAMVSVLWAYDGWTNVTPLAEEIRDPGRNIPRALLCGMAVLIAVYVGMTLAYHYVLPMDEVASASRDSGQIEKAVAAVYCKHLLGRPGVIAISILVMCSTFISLNGNALTGPRAYFAMARDRLFPAALCRVHPRFQTPANAILSQGIWAILLTIAGTVLILVPPPDSAGGLAGPIAGRLEAAQPDAALRPALHLRDLRRQPLLHAGDRAASSCFASASPTCRRPYRTLGYPVTPLLYVAGALVLLGNMLCDHAEPRAVAGRASASSCSACRPTGFSGERTARRAGRHFVTTRRAGMVTG